MATVPPEIHLAIKSSFSNIELVQIVIEEALKQTDLDEDSAHWVGIAAREAVANAVKHGNKQDPEKKVGIDFGVEDNCVVITVKDEGEGFDPQEVPDPLSPDNLLNPSGRGILMMREFMDNVEISAGDLGTSVKMSKRFPVGG